MNFTKYLCNILDIIYIRFLILCVKRFYFKRKSKIIIFIFIFQFLVFLKLGMTFFRMSYRVLFFLFNSVGMTILSIVIQVLWNVLYTLQNLGMTIVRIVIPSLVLTYHTTYQNLGMTILSIVIPKSKSPMTMLIIVIPAV